MNYQEIKDKLELAGWYRLNLSDDYAYFLAGVIEDDDEEEIAKKAQAMAEVRSLIDSIFESRTRMEAADYILENKETLLAKIAAATAAIIRKKGTRHHLSEEERSVERFTHGAIGNDANYVCYALEPHERLDPADFNNAGFLKHVLFLEVKADEVIESWAHFATGSPSEEKESIEAFLHWELGLKKHVNPYFPTLPPVAINEVESKLKSSGWHELDLDDDYDYYLSMVPDWSLRQEELVELDEERKQRQRKMSSAFPIITDALKFSDDRWYFWGKAPGKQDPKEDAEKLETPKKPWKYVRRHLLNESKTVEYFTEGQIKNRSVHKCFALPSDVEPDLTDPGKCGFIKHVLFLKIEGGVVTKYFLQFTVQATSKQRAEISRLLGDVLPWKMPEKWPVPYELDEIAEDMDDCF